MQEPSFRQSIHNAQKALTTGAWLTMHGGRRSRIKGGCRVVRRGQAEVPATPRQRQWFPLVVLGAFFEDFDFSAVKLALPYISKDFYIGTQSAGFMLSVIALGTLVAFFVVRLGDRIGRRPVFLLVSGLVFRSQFGHRLCSRCDTIRGRTVCGEGVFSGSGVNVVTDPAVGPLV